MSRGQVLENHLPKHRPCAALKATTSLSADPLCAPGERRALGQSTACPAGLAAPPELTNAPSQPTFLSDSERGCLRDIYSLVTFPSSLSSAPSTALGTRLWLPGQSRGSRCLEWLPIQTRQGLLENQEGHVFNSLSGAQSGICASAAVLVLADEGGAGCVPPNPDRGQRRRASVSIRRCNQT